MKILLSSKLYFNVFLLSLSRYFYAVIYLSIGMSLSKMQPHEEALIVTPSWEDESKMVLYTCKEDPRATNTHDITKIQLGVGIPNPGTFDLSTANWNIIFLKQNIKWIYSHGRGFPFLGQVHINLHPKKFQRFWLSLRAQKGRWTGCCKNGRPIFLAFFLFRPLLPMENVISFEIFYLVMVKVTITIHNWKSFTTAFHMQISTKFDQIQNYPGRSAANIMYCSFM